MKDRVLEDEARHDRQCAANEVIEEQCLAVAQTEYEAGQIDDWIEDLADTHDTFLIAHQVIKWLDALEAGDFGSDLLAVEKLHQWLPACSVRDFRAHIESIVERKAALLAEES